MVQKKKKKALKGSKAASWSKQGSRGEQSREVLQKKIKKNNSAMQEKIKKINQRATGSKNEKENRAVGVVFKNSSRAARQRAGASKAAAASGAERWC